MFATLWFKLASYASAAIVAAFLSGYVVHRMDASKLSDLKAANERAVTEAVKLASDRQAAQDKITLESAVAEAQAQQHIVTRTVTLTQKVPVYVTQKADAHACVPLGLLRVLDAAALQTDPDALPLPAGKSNDSCASLDASVLAQRLLANLGKVQANAEQLNQLEGGIRKQEQASK